MIGIFKITYKNVYARDCVDSLIISFFEECVENFRVFPWREILDERTKFTFAEDCMENFLEYFYGKKYSMDGQKV